MSENKILKEEKVCYIKTAGNLFTICRTCNRPFVEGEMIIRYTILRNEIREQRDQCSFCSREREKEEKAVAEYEAGLEKVGRFSASIIIALNVIIWRLTKATKLAWWTWALIGAFISIIIHLLMEWGYRLKYGPKPKSDRFKIIAS